jgi:hypothetical protein
MKICSKCKSSKDEEGFYKKADGSCRSQCKFCENSYKPERKAWLSANYKESKSKKEKMRRRDPLYTCQYILTDSRKSDRKKGFDNDLTLEFIIEITKNGCSYCGETKLRMTLDRIDNTKGHIQSNVNGACIRCNYARGSMPYEAWMCLVPAIRVACEKKFFGDWTGRARVCK